MSRQARSVARQCHEPSGLRPTSSARPLSAALTTHRQRRHAVRASLAVISLCLAIVLAPSHAGASPSIDVETMKLKRGDIKRSGIGGAIGEQIADDDERTYYFLGTDGDWFNGANWIHGASGRVGTVPGAHDEAVISGDRVVRIDGQAHGAAVAIGMILQFDTSRLELLPDTLLHYDNYLAVEDSSLGLFSAAMEPPTPSGGGGGSGTGWGCRTCGFSNPSSVVTSLLDLQGANFQFGLGGLLPAHSGATGQGHFANFSADKVLLEGAELSLALHYGFTPRTGDVFQIVSVADQVFGHFAHAAEGARIAVFGDVGLTISYHGGDGNDIVLKAAPVPLPSGLALMGGALSVLLLGRRHRVRRPSV